MHRSREYDALEILGPAPFGDEADWAPRLLLAQTLVGRALKAFVGEAIPLTPEGEIEQSKLCSLQALADQAFPPCGIKVRIMPRLHNYALQVRLDHPQAVTYALRLPDADRE